MHWAVTAPFFQPGSSTNRWLIDFVPPGQHTFTPVAPRLPPSSVRHSGTETTTDGWKLSWNQAADAWALRPDGLITLFPPLATVAGVQKRLRRRDRPLVAWCFNLGKLYHGPRGVAARFGLSAVDRFVCHSSFEVDQYSRWLRLPRERFTFVPLQRANLSQPGIVPDEERPFVIALGSAKRDYATLFTAVEKLGYRTIVVAAPHAIAGLRVPPNVEIRNGLSIEACVELAQRARVNVVPVANDQTASGQITVIQAMHCANAIVATDCPGTRDYLRHDQTALLAPPSDANAMADAIRGLWDSPAARRQLGEAARVHARDHYSDEAAGVAIGRVLDEVAGGR